MGSWGYKALESDEGLDVLDKFKTYINKNKVVELGSLVDFFRDEGFIGRNRDDIDFLYDNSLLAIAELYTTFKEKSQIIIGEKSLDIDAFFVKQEPVKSSNIYIHNKVLNLLIEGLDDIYNNRPDEDGDREYTVLNREGSLAKEWDAHILEIREKLFHEKKL